MNIERYFDKLETVPEQLVPLLNHYQLEGDGIVEKGLGLYMVHHYQNTEKANRSFLSLRNFLHEEAILGATAVVLMQAHNDDDVLRDHYRQIAGLIFEQQWNSAVRINALLERINNKRSPGVTRKQIVYAARLAVGVYDALLRESQPFNPELDINYLVMRIGRDIRNSTNDSNDA